MIVIRRAKSNEGRKIMEFEMRVWQDKEVVSRYEAVNLARFGYTFVAVDNGEIIGVIVGMKTRDDKIKIVDWLVDEKYRGQGIGVKLYDKLKKETKGCEIISFINCKNLRSLSAHQKIGFLKFGKIKDPYCSGDGSVWWKLKFINK